MSALRMPWFTTVLHYFAHLPGGKLVLWCYLIWWSTTVIHHFDPAPSVWLNALGISGIIGFALLLSVGGLRTATQNGWQTFRLFAMPFGVSSFSSLIKGKGFIVVFPPSTAELAISVGLCALFVGLVYALKLSYRPLK